MPAPERRRRLAVAGLLAYAAAAVAVLVSPVSPGAIVEALGSWMREDLGLVGFGQGWIEFVANIVLFLPLGVLLTLLLGRVWIALVLAVTLSVAVELVQFVLPARLPSVRDVLANGLGAAAGVLLAWLFIRRSRPGRPRATRRVR